MKATYNGSEFVLGTAKLVVSSPYFTREEFEAFQNAEREDYERHVRENPHTLNLEVVADAPPKRGFHGVAEITLWQGNYTATNIRKARKLVDSLNA